MAWKPKPDKWDWRRFLTAEERAVIERSDRHAERIKKLQQAHEKRFGRARQLIVNRAIHRAKYEHRSAVNQ